MTRSFLILALLASLAGAAFAAPAEPFDLQAIRLEHDELRAGQPTEIRVVVKNLGPGKAAGVRAAVTANGKPLGILRAREDLRPGQEVVLWGTMTPPSAGAQTLEAVLGPEDGNAANNTVRLEVTVEAPLRPDLQVEEIKIPKKLAVGEETMVLVRVVNLGDAGTGGAHLFLEAGGKTVASHRLQSHLKPGQREEVVLRWTPRDEGATVVAAKVDAGDRVVEGDETNNRQEVAVTVGARKVPDLQPTEIVLPEALRQGTPVELYVKVANKGEAAAYSVPLVLKVNGKPAAERMVRLEIGSGMSRTIPMQWLPNEAGDLALEVEVDPEARHPDSVRTNNTLQATATVAGRPVPDLQAVRIDAPEEAYVGDKLKMEAVVRNEGELPVFSCRAVLFVDGQPVATGNSPAGIEPGGETVVPLTFTAMAPGTLSLEVRVETTGTVEEVNKEDNRATAEVRILEPRRRQ